MDLFLKISVLQTTFCWPGDFENTDMFFEWKSCWEIAAMCYLSETSPPPSKTHTHTEGLNYALWPNPNWPGMAGHTSAGKLPSN